MVLRQAAFVSRGMGLWKEILLFIKRLAGRGRAWCLEKALERSETLEGPLNKRRNASKKRKKINTCHFTG